MRLNADILRVCHNYLGSQGTAYCRGDWHLISRPFEYAAREGLLDLLSAHNSSLSYPKARSLRTVKFLYFVLRIQPTPHFNPAVYNSEILGWLLGKGVKFTCATRKWVAQRGNVEMLRLLMPVSAAEATWLCYHAALGGSVECLLLLESFGAALGEKISSGAAREGHLNVLQFVLDRGLSWDPDTCELVASAGDMQCFDFAMRHAPAWNPRPEAVVEVGRLDVLQYMCEKRGMRFNAEACSLAASQGHMQILEFLVGKGCAYTADTCALAARWNNLGMVALLRDKWDARTCQEAAAHADGVVLRYAFDNGCTWDIETCNNAAHYGNVANLEFAHTNGCPWAAETCAAAADECWVCPERRLAALEYLVSHGCPLSAEVFECAALSGQVDICAFLRRSNCPYNAKALYMAVINRRHVDLLRYMLDNKQDFKLDPDVHRLARIVDSSVIAGLLNEK